MAFRGEMNLFAESLLMERRVGMSQSVADQEGQHLSVALPGCSCRKVGGARTLIAQSRPRRERGTPRVSGIRGFSLWLF